MEQKKEQEKVGTLEYWLVEERVLVRAELDVLLADSLAVWTALRLAAPTAYLRAKTLAAD